MNSLLDEVLNKINNSKLNLYGNYDLLKEFKKAKIIYSNPEMIKDSLYCPGICMLLSSSNRHIMDYWRNDLNLSCWKATSYWIKPSYDYTEDFEESCKDRVAICDAIINNLTKHS